MFDFIADAVENVLDITDNLLEGEAPTKRQVAKLASDGLSIAAIASVTGLASDVIERMIND